MSNKYKITLQEKPEETCVASSNLCVEVGSPWRGEVGGVKRTGKVTFVDHSKKEFTVTLNKAEN